MGGLKLQPIKDYTKNSIQSKWEVLEVNWPIRQTNFWPIIFQGVRRVTKFLRNLAQPCYLAYFIYYTKFQGPGAEGFGGILSSTILLSVFTKKTLFATFLKHWAKHANITNTITTTIKIHKIPLTKDAAHPVSPHWLKRSWTQSGVVSFFASFTSSCSFWMLAWMDVEWDEKLKQHILQSLDSHVHGWAAVSRLQHGFAGKRVLWFLHPSRGHSGQLM